MRFDWGIQVPLVVGARADRRGLDQAQPNAFARRQPDSKTWRAATLRIGESPKQPAVSGHRLFRASRVKANTLYLWGHRLF